MRLPGDLAGKILWRRNILETPGKSLVRRLVVLLDCKDNVEVAILGGGETESSLTRILILNEYTEVKAPGRHCWYVKHLGSPVPLPSCSIRPWKNIASLVVFEYLEKYLDIWGNIASLVIFEQFWAAVRTQWCRSGWGGTVRHWEWGYLGWGDTWHVRIPEMRGYKIPTLKVFEDTFLLKDKSTNNTNAWILSSLIEFCWSFKFYWNLAVGCILYWISNLQVFHPNFSLYWVSKFEFEFEFETQTCKSSIQSPVEVPVSGQNNEPPRLRSPSDCHYDDNHDHSKQRFWWWHRLLVFIFTV